MHSWFNSRVIKLVIMSTVELAGPQLSLQHRGLVHSCARDKSQQLSSRPGGELATLPLQPAPVCALLWQANMATPAYEREQASGLTSAFVSISDLAPPGPRGSM